MSKGGQSKGASSPELKAAWKLYDAGDILAARRAARALAQGGGASDQDKAEAKDLLDRTGFPKMGVWMAALAGGVILAMVLLAIARSAH